MVYIKKEGKMKSKLAVALCLTGMLGFVGLFGLLNASFSGNLDDEATTFFPAPVEKTGQKTSYGPRDDGRLRKGVAWPKPRFKDQKNGTVKDNLTGLIWLQNANCSKFWATDATGQNTRHWNEALTAANKLKSGACGLTDGSVAGDWRLPNIKELQSLIDFGFDTPALPNRAGTGKWTEGDPFFGVLSDYYWSSTTFSLYTVNAAWLLDLYYGDVHWSPKTTWTSHVWPVRGGQ
jgi:hypothetical protein